MSQVRAAVVALINDARNVIVGHGRTDLGDGLGGRRDNNLERCNEGSMSFAFFIYTILVMGIGLVTASTALVIWLMTRRRDCLVAAAGFLLYVFDMSVIFFDEYNRLKYDYVVTFNEPLQHPLLRCALGVAILACVWLWVTFRLHDEVTVKRVAAYVVPIAVLQLALVPRTGCASQIQQ